MFIDRFQVNTFDNRYNVTVRNKTRAYVYVFNFKELKHSNQFQLNLEQHHMISIHLPILGMQHYLVHLNHAIEVRVRLFGFFEKENNWYMF